MADNKETEKRKDGKTSNKRTYLSSFSSLVFLFFWFLLRTVCFAQENAVEKNISVEAAVLAPEQAPPAGEAVSAQETETAAQAVSEPPQAATSANFLSEAVVKVRTAKDEGRFADVYRIVGELTERFGPDALREQKSLKDFPPTGQIDNYAALNGLAQAQFVKAEALKNEGRNDEAISVFSFIIKEYGYAQAWDPRGWYYKLADIAQEAMDRLQGTDPKAEKCGSIAPTQIELYDPGKEEIVDYGRYGEFKGAGTKDYKYVVKSQDLLSEAAGEGIYPNTTSVRWDPQFQILRKEKRLEGSHWDFVHSPDLQAAFIKWVLAPEPPGIKLFYTALILEKAGLIKHAIKAYYAIVVHFPHTVGWTYWHTPWYVGPASIAKIKHLCKKYPQVNMKLVGAEIRIENGTDNDISNDIFIIDPGKVVKNHMPETLVDRIKRYLDEHAARSKIKRKLGSGKVRFVQYENSDWQLLVDNKPYEIRGITYAVVKVGQSPDDGSLKNWTDYDYNKNGKCDGPYDAFVDVNRDNRQGPDERPVGDFELMRQMGVNTIRIYHQPFEVNKGILRDLYQRYGIRVIMGDFLGKYALGSGAKWEDGTDYENPEHKKKMLESVARMVAEHKDEPYILMWVLGNENVYGVACNADKKPAAFFKFANEAAKLIKTLDPDHPVAIASGDVLFLSEFAKHAPDVDVFGANSYRGDYGFGDYWQLVKDMTGRPAFITEYGCSAYVYCMSRQKAEEAQAEYLKNAWEDIKSNMAFGTGAGNAVGGILFEWLDEWWKGYEPSVHDTKGLWVGPFPDGYMHEEWLGVAGQGDGSLSPFLRQLRKSYYVFQKLWEK